MASQDDETTHAPTTKREWPSFEVALPKKLMWIVSLSGYDAGDEALILCKTHDEVIAFCKDYRSRTSCRWFKLDYAKYYAWVSSNQDV